MPRYIYTATKQGKKITGSVEAASKESAIQTLAHQDIHALGIKEDSGGQGQRTAQGPPQSKAT
jgi:type II secretory pathway component PulF